MFEDEIIQKKDNFTNINTSLDEYIRNLQISDKWIKIFKAYKISLNKSRDEIINILNKNFLKDDKILLNQIAYKISIELENEMKDTNFKVKNILEWALWIEHNYNKAA